MVPIYIWIALKHAALKMRYEIICVWEIKITYLEFMMMIIVFRHTFSNAFSEMKIIGIFLFKFHLSVFPGKQLTIGQR